MKTFKDVFPLIAFSTKYVAWNHAVVYSVVFFIYTEWNQIVVSSEQETNLIGANRTRHQTECYKNLLNLSNCSDTEFV